MTLQVIVGGQLGSEGKGAIAGYLAAEKPDLLAVRVAGPNAGHTVIGRCPPGCATGGKVLEYPSGLPQADPGPGYHRHDAHPWKLRHVPVAAVTNEEAVLALGPGSEIDLDVLKQEITDLDAAGYHVSSRIWLDPSSNVITDDCKGAEQSLVSRIGSTGKGIGIARAGRVMRTALLVGDVDDLPCLTADVGEFARHRLLHRGHVQIEGTQGYGLGQHAGYYPFCTSSDCTATDFLAMAGIPPWLAGSAVEVWVVYRTYPIRVAGNSGPLRYETTWEVVGQPEERTTVTNKVRRVGSWDKELARNALLANGWRPGSSNVFAALTMMDYNIDGIAGVSDITAVSPDDLDLLAQAIAKYSHDIGTLTRLVGTGPATVLDYRKVEDIPVRHLEGRIKAL